MYRRTGKRYLEVEMVCNARYNITGEVNIGLYSGRDFILRQVLRLGHISRPANGTYLASVRDAALAMTVFARFCIAVSTSSSDSEVGGTRCESFCSGMWCFQRGS